MAESAENDQYQGCATRVRHLARIPRLGGRIAVHAMANVGVRPPDALPGAGVRFRCVNRAHNVPREEGRGRHARCPGDQAIGGEMQPKTILALALCSTWVAGCATRTSDSEADRAVAEMMKASFKTRGQASVDRLKQDEVQALCS